MRFHVGCDHAGIELLDEALRIVESAGHVVASRHGPRGAGEKADYPDVAVAVARAVAAEPGAFGILVCGSGQGMAMTANRFRGVRAAVCSDPYSAAMARAHNDANVLCLGQRVVGPGVAELVLRAFLAGTFEGGRHAARVDKVNAAGG